MLTNNKKSFVRSIAVLLVMLMVFAMGLTACGGDAVTKEEVETTVADKLTAALADYVKKDDEATVKAIVEKVLADGNISAEKLDELSAALEAYLTADDVKALIKSELASLALEDALNKDDVLEILKDYYTKDEIDAKFKDYFGNFKAAEIQKILTDADKAMNGEEWDAATDIVIETIEYAKKLIAKLYSETYLQERMQEVNTILDKYTLFAFEKVTLTENNNSYDFYKNAHYETFVKYVEYMILRQPTVEAMTELKDTLDAAYAVKTFEDEQKALKARLLALGENVAYGSYIDQIFVPAGANKTTQVVTLHDKADFYTWNEDLDTMLATYVTDKKNLTETTVDPAAYGLTVLYVWTKDNTVVINNTGVAPATGYTRIDVSVATVNYLEHVHGVKSVDALEDLDTILLPEIPVFSTQYKEMLLNEATYSVETDWQNTDNANGINKYGYLGNEKVYSSKTLGNAGLVQSLAYLKVAKEYNAIIAQLIECQTAANEANRLFDKFQKDVIYANTATLKATYKTYTKYDVETIGGISINNTGLNDPGLVNALTISMCEPHGKYAYSVYLTDINNAYANVTKEMEESCILNNNGTDSPEIGIDEYDLYLKMMSRAYDLLWEKYKTLALEWADKMLNDYVSVTYEAEMNAISTNAAPVYSTLSYSSLADDEDLWIAMLVKEGEWAADELVTEGFINAFYNGAALPIEPVDQEVNIYNLLGWSFENAGLNKFYINNGKALDASINAAGGLTFTGYYANPLNVIKYSSEDIRDLLSDSMRNVDAAINGAVLEEKKDSGVPVQKAFYEYLKDGILNLEEIYDRFLIQEYAKMICNDMDVLAKDVTDFYSEGYNQKNLFATVEGYLFGAANDFNGNKAYMGASSIKDGKYTALNKGDVTYTSAVIIDKNTNTWKKFGFGLKTETFADAVFAKTALNPYAESVDGTTPKIAGDAMKAMRDLYAQATATVENIVIKAQFLNYIDTARGNLDDLAAAYWQAVRTNDKDDTATINDLNYVKGNNELAIVNIKYYADRDEYALDTYKAEYKNLLSIISGKNSDGVINPHLALLNEDVTIEQIIADNKLADSKLDVAVFEDMLAEVETYAHMRYCYAAGCTDSSWLEPYTSYDKFEFVGSAAVEVDEAVNGDETCTCITGCALKTTCH